MLKRFIRKEMFSVKIDPERWLVLITKGLYNWNLRVVGPEPLDVDMGEFTGQEAKNRAISMAVEHFRSVNPRVVIYRNPQWRLALSSERGYTG
jgi:hypothetical protein